MFGDLTLNSIFWLFLGVMLIAAGGYVGYSMRSYPFATGMAFLGLGCCFCGITNGFTDYSAKGRLLWRFGIPLILLGLALTGYSLSRYI